MRKGTRQMKCWIPKELLESFDELVGFRNRTKAIERLMERVVELATRPEQSA